MFKEMAKLRGIEVRYQYLYSNLDYSIHTELKGSYSEPIAMNIIFEEYPRQSTLKRLGWFSEDLEQKDHLLHNYLMMHHICKKVVEYL